jgi:hypothetical protein
MLFVLTDERHLDVVDDVHEASRRYEAYDVESGDIVFYDRRGRRFAPTFPYRDDTRILGLRVTNDPGPYELMLDPDALPELLEELPTVRSLEENAWFQSLDQVRAALEAGEDAA